MDAIERAIDRAARVISKRIQPTIAWEEWGPGDHDRWRGIARAALDEANYREVMETAEDAASCLAEIRDSRLDLPEHLRAAINAKIDAVGAARGRISRIWA